MTRNVKGQFSAGKYALGIAALGLVFCIALAAAHSKSRAINARPLGATEMSAIVGDGTFCRWEATCDTAFKEGASDCSRCSSSNGRAVCCPNSYYDCFYDGGPACSGEIKYKAAMSGSSGTCLTCTGSLQPMGTCDYTHAVDNGENSCTDM
jgi:hypothetical protein